MRYKDSGVDIDKANEATRSIAQDVRSTWGGEVLSEVGSFGGLFRIPDGYQAPVLVSSMDGVGTKILVASRAGRFDTVGQDLVNHCVNDILVQGARPLYFLDYIAAGRLEPRVVADVVKGLATACRENGCALIGGETAEMPGVYHGDDFDLAGTIVGVVERDGIVDGGAIAAGDVVLAFESSGLHTNGFSLARNIVFESAGLDVDDEVPELGATVADELLRVHRSYLAPVAEMMKTVTVKGLAHITGGGVVENLPRVLPSGCAAVIRRGTWPEPSIFAYLAAAGQVPDAEMFRVFNMGLGMLAVVSQEDAARLGDTLAGHTVHTVGEIVAGDRFVDIVPA
jgi:phosphoribosylformylglycinamidine cyclo-ligase